MLRSKFSAYINSEWASLLVFPFWPLIGFLIAIRNFSFKSSKYVILAFFVLYGFTVIYLKSDLYTTYLGFKQFVSEFGTISFKKLNDLYREDDIDILQKIIVFIVSLFTKDVRILFSVYALIFGFLYIKGINLVYPFYKLNKNPNAWLMLFLLILVIPITALGNFRFFSAVWIFFIGAFNVVYYKDYKYLAIVFLSVLMHFGLSAASVLLLIYLAVGNRNNIYIPLVIVSFIIPSFAGDIINHLGTYLGGGFENRTSSYLNEDYVDQIRNVDFSWFLTFRNYLMDYYIYIMYIVSFYFWSKVENKGVQNLFSFSLLLLAFTNFVIDVPSLGIRYRGIFQLFAFTFLFFAMLYKYISVKKLNVLAAISLIPLIFHFIITLRVASENINVCLLLPTPFPFMGDPISVWSLFDY